MTPFRALIGAVGGWIGRRTTTQLSAALAILAAAALSASLFATGLAARMDQREQAALAALDDYGAMVSKLGEQATLTTEALTPGDAAFLSAWLSAFQNGPTRDQRSLEETCRTGRGGAGVRFIRAPVGKPAGLAALETGRAERLPRLGPDLYLVQLDKGSLCSNRAVEAVVVRRTAGSLNIIVGRVVEPSGEAWGWAVLAVLATGAVILGSGLAAALFARRRLTSALAEVSEALDRAATGDLSRRAPEVGVAPELTELTAKVNRTLDRLQELLTWMRDSSDQLAHDFRTPLARATARLEQLQDATGAARRKALAQEAGEDLMALTRAMNDALALRDGAAWVFEDVRLDQLLHQVAELYEPLIEARGGAMTVQADGPVTILGVRTLMQRALANLVDNAVKHSPDGGRVILRAWRDETGCGVSITDQGTGFDPAAPCRVEGVESHGMGLPFVRAVVHRHGGRLTVDDAAPGAVVTAHFPR
ncbi:MAG TPA: HAMP domain-containing sensor histidine kinase [Brevundimonas sp.]|uniref:HAMP domain-containing sensor histidine kinase n=1 Tax=Brevundimonas sp. TaxID=1871086 RepID=UPI00262357B2|nr:HAMP domain-containing sensor histidine kinase [Brevundimonas sp.]HRO33827.1 HAMP domain-containing sensor histidine kinase [Brevundimonas sp.]